jgi:hypothetical protein
MKLSIIAAAACLALTACGTATGPATAPAPAVSASTISLRLSQAYASSLNAYTGLTDVYLAAVKADVLKGEAKEQARGALIKVYSGLMAAKSARDKGDALAALAEIGNVDSLIAQARRVLPAAR